MDTRTTVLGIARGRIVMGLAMLILPGVMLRVLFGREASTPSGRVLARMFGAREFVLGVGTVTSVKEFRTGSCSAIRASAASVTLTAEILRALTARMISWADSQSLWALMAISGCKDTGRLGFV